MRLFNVVSRKKYVQNGEIRNKLMIAGMLRMTDAGKMFLTMYMLPETEFCLFEKEPKKEDPVIQLE